MNNPPGQRGTRFTWDGRAVPSMSLEGRVREALNASNEAAARIETDGRGAVRAGPTLPLAAREGDVLQFRAGQWIAVSPREAFQIERDPRIQNGAAPYAEFFDGFTVVPRGEPVVEDNPKPSEPLKTTPLRRTAWDRLLEDDPGVDSPDGDGHPLLGREAGRGEALGARTAPKG